MMLSTLLKEDILHLMGTREFYDFSENLQYVFSNTSSEKSGSAETCASGQQVGHFINILLLLLTYPRVVAAAPSKGNDDQHHSKVSH